MNEQTLTELDFFRIRDTVAGYAVSDEGKELLLERVPLTDTDEISRLKNLSRQWQIFLEEADTNPLLFFPPVKNIFSAIKVNGYTLSLGQMHSLLQFCLSAQSTASAIKSATEKMEITQLAEEAAKLPDLSPAVSAISHVITKDGEMRDLPELREIRTRIISLSKKIDSIMHSYTSDSRYNDLLESNVPALRAGRQTLAVNASRRNSIPGIIVEVSQSGKTVYIEPEEAVLAGNELMQEEANLQRAIHDILQNLTTTLTEYADSFSEAHKIIMLLDGTQAASRWGMTHNCVYAADASGRATSANASSLSLIEARHPLIKNPVPITVQFMEGTRILVITGANTGGKTVTLKTTALFALLNQAGFPVPATEGTALPIFEDVFADIGDGQSLDESLSTFSAHMKNCATAISHATPRSLILLDELGSGTDPLEGSAIALAILDKLSEIGATVLVTTHQGVLKNYAWTHEHCANASVEFDAETLSPTYKIVMGLPGESRALDIAERNGISPNIVAKARDYIAGEQADVSALIKGLTEKSRQLDLLAEENQQKAEKLSKKENRLSERELKLQERELALKNDANTEAKQFLIDARSRLENLVREIREDEITREKTLSVKKFISDLETEIATQKNSLERETAKLNNESTATTNNTNKKIVFSPGTEIITVKNRRNGTLVSQSGKNKWLVQFGSIKLEMKESEIEPAPTSAFSVAAMQTPSVTVELAERSDGTKERPQFELRLLGLRQDEAIKQLERQLDLCVMQNFKSFSVIHGKGDGILQQAVRDYLSHYKGVKEFHFATPENGGFGKTEVTMM